MDIFSPRDHDPEPSEMSPTPLTATERRLADIWSSLLGINNIGRYDDFLSLGGDSILGTQCLYLIRDSFQVDLTLTTLFVDSALLIELADVIDAARAGKFLDH